MVLIPASSLGKSGWESKAELDSDTELLSRIESIRQQASLKMGLGDATGKVLPKVSLLAKPQHGGTLSSRYFVPSNCHAAHDVTGAICVATAAMLPGTITDGLLVDRPAGDPAQISVEHPSGKIDILLDLTRSNARLQINRAGLVRTARKLFRGELYVPGRVWSQQARQVVVATSLSSAYRKPGADELLVYLQRHGIAAVCKGFDSRHKAAGTALLALAGELRSELLVMRANSHRRVHEQIFGGMTRYMVAHAKMPIFMMH
ncbi:MAG: nucleotide-binding universal stress UspA family protein [Motiliproteus sp.]|jgi:nucleotide-binding universal stress UspA family protein